MAVPRRVGAQLRLLAEDKGMKSALGYELPGHVLGSCIFYPSRTSSLGL